MKDRNDIPMYPKRWSPGNGADVKVYILIPERCELILAQRLKILSLKDETRRKLDKILSFEL